MNRIQSGTAPGPHEWCVDGDQAGFADSAFGARYSSPRGETHLALFAPLHYEPNYAYPLLVWLHGPGDDERQLKRIMPAVSLRNYVAVAVRGTRRSGRAAGGAGYTWSLGSADVALAEQRVFEGIEAASARCHVAAHRVFIAGFAAGGTLAFRLAMDHPRRFAGVLSLGGEFPAVGMPLRRLSEARRLPIFLVSGRDSREFPPQRVCENLKLFHSAGLSVSLRQYPCGHEIALSMLGDMDRWMMEQITAPAESGAARP